MENSFKLMESRTRAVEYLLNREAWDFFMVVYFDTDRLLHQVWHYLDNTHPWFNGHKLENTVPYVRQYFEALDEKLGRILSFADEDTTVVLLSDHGMGAAHYFIILNLWLLQQGYLVLKDDALTRVKRWLWG